MSSHGAGPLILKHCEIGDVNKVRAIEQWLGDRVIRPTKALPQPFRPFFRIAVYSGGAEILAVI